MKNLQRRFIAWSSFFIFTFFSSQLLGQLNLVINGSFEEYLSCPTNVSQIDYCIGWDTLMQGGSSPDYLNKCYTTDFLIGVPNNFAGYQEPKSGNGYTTLLTYSSNEPDVVDREYIQGQLFNKLLENKSYCVTFYVSYGYYYSKRAIDRIGAYIDDGSVIAPNDGLAIAIPQIESNSIQNGGVYLKDTLEWIKVQNTLKANGNENHITIGNFRSNDSINTLLFGGCFECATYYYIDDVSVIDINSKAYAGKDTLIGAGDSIFIGLPEVGDHFNWYANGTLIHSGSEAGIWVKPTISTQYVCEQQVCSYVTRDTVDITVEGFVGLKKDGTSTIVRLLSNPSNDGVLKIYAPASNEIRLRVSGVSGSVGLVPEALEANMPLQTNGNHIFENSAIIYKPGVYMVEIMDVETLEIVTLKWVVL